MDRKNNLWLKTLAAFLLVMVSATVLAQVNTGSATMATKASGSSIIDTIVEAIIGILVLAGPLFMIGHMIYTLVDTKRLQRTETVDKYIGIRQRKGLAEQMSDEELDQCYQYIDDAYCVLSVVETDYDGNESRKPGKMRELLKSKRIIGLVLKMNPTDADIVDQCNEYNHFLYDYMQRSFFSSWKLIILSVLVAIGISFIGDGGFFKEFFTVGCLFWIPAIVYYISGNVPQYMIDKKAARGGGQGWLVSILVAAGIGILGSGYTVRTHYTDGSHSDDSSAHWIALMLGIMVLIAVALTIYLWAIINYLRNYVLFL